AKAGNFAADAHMAELILDGAFDRLGDFADGKFGGIGEGVGHALWCDIRRAWSRGGRRADEGFPQSSLLPSSGAARHLLPRGEKGIEVTTPPLRPRVVRRDCPSTGRYDWPARHRCHHRRGWPA